MSSRFTAPFFDVGSGIKPSDGAQLFFFDTGTSTPRNTFSDQLSTPTPNGNPVIANSKGVFSDIFIDGVYKVVLKDKDNVQIWEADPVASLGQQNDIAGIAQNTANNTVRPLDDIKSDTLIPVDTGIVLESSEYITGSKVGGGSYQKVSSDPGDNLSNPATSDGNWLLLINEGFSALGSNWGDTGTNSTPDQTAVIASIENDDLLKDARSGTSVAVRTNQTASIQMDEITWPVNAITKSLGATRESVTHINNISDNESQVIPVTTDIWLANTAYTQGIKRVNGAQLYQVETQGAGTSAASGGPTGTGTGIVDGTVTWKSINNGLFTATPVNEARIHAPYHPGFILDAKTALSYGSSQEAQDIAQAIADAGNTNTSQYRSFIWALDGVSEWQLVADGILGDMSFHKRTTGDANQLWRMHFNNANGDLQIQHPGSLDDSRPIDCAGAMRVFIDNSVNSTVRSDNKARFTKASYDLRQFDSATSDNNASISLQGATGHQLTFNAPDDSALGGNAESSQSWTVHKSTGELSSINFSGFFRAFHPNQTALISLGKAGNLWSEVFASNATINTSDGRLKTTLSKMNEAEIKAAMEMEGLIGTYKMLKAIEIKGSNGARIHVGAIVQDIIAVMESHGLDPFAYSFICYDEWEATEAVYSENSIITEPAVKAVFGDNGIVIAPPKEAVYEVKRTLTAEAKPAGDAFGLRYSQFILFVMMGARAQRIKNELRMSSLEERLDALEL